MGVKVLLLPVLQMGKLRHRETEFSNGQVLSKPGSCAQGIITADLSKYQELVFIKYHILRFVLSFTYVD